jgi:Tol biopolymer transport system component
MSRFLAILGGLVLLTCPARAQLTERVSLNSSGTQGNFGSTVPSTSADARCVAFTSFATNLVAGDLNTQPDVFVRDRQTGTTERASVDSTGVEANNWSESASISADGRYVAFHSLASNLVPGDTNAIWDVFVHDRLTGITERVSVDSGGIEGSDSSTGPSISGDGRFVAFTSSATNLVAGDTNGDADVFVRDRQLGTTERVSISSAGAQGGHPSEQPSISPDGRFVAFISYSGNLVSGDTNGNSIPDVFVRDRVLGTTDRVSVGSGGQQANGESQRPSISADGRYVAFESAATTLVPGDTNGRYDVFVFDRQNATIRRVSVASNGAQANNDSSRPSLSADGRYVGFETDAFNLIPGDNNGDRDVYVVTLGNGEVRRVSVSSASIQANGSSSNASINADGRFVAFASGAPNLVFADTNAVADIFLRDREIGTSFQSLCDPGTAGVIPCPCSNPPSGPGAGCNNSSATGGAILSASGGASVGFDSLLFTTSGEKPSALSIVLQGNLLIAPGAVYGQGVRCVGGALKRLYTKSASGGSITAPQLSAGDLSVSARSAATGDPILSGESRWYLVYYRDPTVLGGCPSTSTFNATQTGEVIWSP